LFKGLGTYVEYQWKDSFFMDNGNYLKAPGYDLVNWNLHYTFDKSLLEVGRMSIYFEIRNLFDKTYVAAANNISSSLNATTGIENGAAVLANSTGSIYAGAPRTFYGGLKVNF
ncbi:MAG: TonB-dependent receptor, partial [Proteobacteria bacterium]|nr:TonB-dependent receptor [Pseudomonadota bacterium]